MPCFVHPKFQDAGPIRQLWGQSPYTHIVILSDTESGTSGGVWRSPMRERKPLGGIPVGTKKPLICRGFASVREITDRQAGRHRRRPAPMSRQSRQRTAQSPVRVSRPGSPARVWTPDAGTESDRFRRYVQSERGTADGRGRIPFSEWENLWSDRESGISHGGRTLDVCPVPPQDRAATRLERDRITHRAHAHADRGAHPTGGRTDAGGMIDTRPAHLTRDNGYTLPAPAVEEIPNAPRGGTRESKRARARRLAAKG